MKKSRFRIRNLRAKYSVQVLFIIVLVAGSFTFLAVEQSRVEMKNIIGSVEELTGEVLYDQIKKKVTMVATALSKVTVGHLYKRDIEGISALFNAFKNKEDVISIYLYDSDGIILAEAIADNLTPAEIAAVRVNKKTILGKEVVISRRGNILDVLMPLFMQDKMLGWLRMRFSLSKMQSDIAMQKSIIAAAGRAGARNTLRVSIAIAGILVLLGIMFALKIAHLLIQPILKLTEAAKKISKGDLSVSVDIKSGDELEELADSFNQMAVDLKRFRDEIENYDNTLKQKIEERTKELKDAQVQLIQAAKMATIGTLSGGIAHEINNPLGTILINTQMLIREVKVPSQMDSLRLIEEASMRCRNIVQNLLKYSRPQTVEDYALVGLNEVISDACHLIKSQFEKENIKIVTEYGTMLITKTNANELSQVFTNLFLNARNAIKKIKNSGKIRVKTFLEGKWVVVEVTDDGCGIPQENLGRIFDPFFTTMEVGKGTGLGLFVSGKIIEKYNGVIEVESHLGKGSVFKVKLPSYEKEK